MSPFAPEFASARVSTSESPVSAGESRKNSLLHVSTASVLTIAGGVSITLSARGAHALFSDWMVAIAFATVVQIIVTASLWALPGSSFRRLILLLTAWLVAVSFAIGSAFYTGYVGSSAELIAAMKDEVTLSLSKVSMNIQQSQTEALHAQRKAAEENRRGTYSRGVHGPGTEFRRLSQEAVLASARADQATASLGVVTDALESLKRPGLTAEDVRAIYRDAIAHAGAYAQGVPHPDFSDDTSSFAAVVFGALPIAFASDSKIAPHARSRVRGSLFGASIMELLAFLSAMLRLDLKTRRPDSPGMLARLISALLSLVCLPDALKAALVLRNREYRDPVEAEWMGVIEAQAREQKTRSVHKVVVALLPSGRGTARRDGRRALPNTQLFDESIFRRRPIILHGARSTGVICVDANNQLTPGPRWDQWVCWLVRMLSRAPEHRAHSTVVWARPQLRVVNW